MKLNKFKVFMLFVCCSIVAALFSCTFGFRKAAIADSPLPIAELDSTAGEVLSNFSISEENYTFSASDFVENYDGEQSKYALYTNRSLTINELALENGNELTVFVYLNGENVTETLRATNPITEKPCYVFDLAGKTEDLAYYVSLSVGTASSSSLNFSFYLVQTNTDFNKQNEQPAIEFTYVANGVTYSVTAPYSNETYSTLNLTFPAGSKDNPVYVDFNYLGQDYSLKRVKNSQGEVVTTNQVTNGILNLDKLSFNKSGVYHVEIYDNTAFTNRPNKNHLSYDFKIVNTAEATRGFYINAHLENGTSIILSQDSQNKQISNSTIIADFVNFGLLRDQVSSVEITRSYQPSGSQYRVDRETLHPSEVPASRSFTEDGAYAITIKNTRGQTIYSYEFTILKNIHSSFTLEDKVYKIEDNEESNVAKTFHDNGVVQSSYNDIIGRTTYEFNVVVARSNPSINGVNNGARTQNSVSVSVNGVGKINVYVTLNGNEMMLGKTEYANGEGLPTFTAQGKYFIRITDEMGSTVTKSFNITIKLNTASKILISIAAITVAALIVFIIVSRAKFKVR